MTAELETRSDLGPLTTTPPLKPPKPAGYKKWHRWQWGWLKWMAFVDFVGRIWPRNR